MTAPVAVVLAAVAAALLLRPPGDPPISAPDPATRGAAAEDTPPDIGWLRRHRLWWTLLSGVGAAVFVGGAPGLVAAVVAAVVVWVVVGRSETPDVGRRREAVRRDLPHVVGLLAAGLRSGTSLTDTVELVCQALPGPAADRLLGVAARLRLGASASEVWSEVASDPELAPLGRTLARAQTTGTPVVAAVEALAVDLAGEARAGVEDRARAVGVKAALPLGLCLLPAFLLVGIVPLVAGLAASLDL